MHMLNSWNNHSINNPDTKIKFSKPLVGNKIIIWYSVINFIAYKLAEIELNSTETTGVNVKTMQKSHLLMEIALIAVNIWWLCKTVIKYGFQTQYNNAIHMVSCCHFIYYDCFLSYTIFLIMPLLLLNGEHWTT